MSLVNAITRCVMAATAAEVLRHFPNLSQDVSPKTLRAEIMSAVYDVKGDLRAAANNDVGIVCQRLQDVAQSIHHTDITLSDEMLATKALQSDEFAQKNITELAYRLAVGLADQLSYLRDRDKLPANARALADQVAEFTPAVKAKINAKPEVVIVDMGRLEEPAYQLAVRYNAQEVANVMRGDSYSSFYMTALTSRMSGLLKEVILDTTQKEILIQTTGGGETQAIELFLSPIRYRGLINHLRNILTPEQADRLNVEETLSTIDELSRLAETILTLRSDQLPVIESLYEAARTVQADMWLAHAALLTLFNTRYRDVIILPHNTADMRIPVQKAALAALSSVGINTADIVTIIRYTRNHGINLVLPTLADLTTIYPRALEEVAHIDALDRQKEIRTQQDVAVEAFTAAADVYFNTRMATHGDKDMHVWRRDVAVAKVAAGLPMIDVTTDYLVGMSGSQQLQELYTDMTSRLHGMLNKIVGSVHTSDINTVVCRTVAEAVCRHLRRNALV